MAPKRRTASTRSSTRSTPASNQQSKLSFHSKVTKPGLNQQTKANKKDPETVEKVAKADIQVEDESEVSQPASAEKPSLKQTEQEAASPASAQDPLADGQTVKAEDVLGGRAEQSEAGAVGGKDSGWVADEEEKARKITDTQIKQYWRKKEQERLAPRVHQEDLTVYEKVLREWDMSGQYGPCIGIARLKRWKRANMLGLKPPMEVLAVLLKQMDAGDTKVQRAYVDELMTSRFAES